MRLCQNAHLPVFQAQGHACCRNEGAGGRGCEERAARLAKVDEELHQQMLQSTVGKVEEVLFEQPVDDEHMEGLCGPYLRVVVPGTAELANTIAKVKITGIKEDFLLGELN